MSHNPLYSPYTQSFRQFSGLRRRKINKKRSLFELKKNFSVSERRQEQKNVHPTQLALFEEKQSASRQHFQAIGKNLAQLTHNPITIMVGMLMVAVLLGIAQLPYTHDLAAKGYDVKRLEVAHKELMDKYDRTNVQIAQAKSSQTLAASKIVLAMNRPRSIDYVEAPNMSVVASKN